MMLESLTLKAMMKKKKSPLRAGTVYIFDAPTNLRFPYDCNFTVDWDDRSKNKLRHHVNKENDGNHL